MNPAPGRLPTMHIVGESIPQTLYRAVKAVWNGGAFMETEYDRKDASGKMIDPPSREGRVLIEVLDPFAQPRFPPISYCEIGTYIAEIMGVKDNNVIPMYLLNKMVAQQELTGEETTFVNHWPYTYHQRLFEHPETDGNIVDQIQLAIATIARKPFSRRAVCSTAVPNLDPFLTEDIPCLRELMMRCAENENGELMFNPTTTWRSRDLFKAWGDNCIGLTFLLARIADTLSNKMGRPVLLGSYAEFSASLHIYGQDFSKVGGDKEKGMAGFFATFPTEEDFIAKSLTSEMAADMLVIPQLQKLLTDSQIKQWGFEQPQIEQIEDLIAGIANGTYIC